MQLNGFTLCYCCGLGTYHQHRVTAANAFRASFGVGGCKIFVEQAIKIDLLSPGILLGSSSVPDKTFPSVPLAGFQF